MARLDWQQIQNFEAGKVTPRRSSAIRTLALGRRASKKARGAERRI
jgi:hypothetical protein